MQIHHKFLYLSNHGSHVASKCNTRYILYSKEVVTCQLLFTAIVSQCNLMILAYLHDIKGVRNCNSNLTIQPNEAWFKYTCGMSVSYRR